MATEAMRRCGVDPRAVANEFLIRSERDGHNVSNMKLQKLVSFAHGYFLARTGMPLLDQPIEAWEHGPVVPSLYRLFKDHKNEPIPPQTRAMSVEPRKMELAAAQLADDDHDVKAVIDEVWTKYGALPAARLRRLTHAEGTPWAAVNQLSLKTHGKLMRKLPIPNSLIERHYRELVKFESETGLSAFEVLEGLAEIKQGKFKTLADLGRRG